MDIKYEEPETEWVCEAAHDTLIVHVPEYKKEELKVQVMQPSMRIRGERQVGENKVRRFLLKFPTPANCDTHGITASLKDGMLYVKFPRKPVPSTDKVDQEEATQKVSPMKDKDKQTSEGITAAEPQKHEDVRKNQKEDQEQFEDKEAPPKTTVEKPRIEKTGDGVEKTDGVSSKTTDKGKEGNDRNGKISDKTTEKVQEVTGEVNRLDDHQTGLGVCKEVFGGLVMVIRNPRRMMNLLLALLLVVVLGLYVKNAFMSMFGETDDFED